MSTFTSRIRRLSNFGAGILRLWNGDIWGLGLILLAGIGLRFFRLGHQGLFFDEAWSWAVSRLSPMEILRVSSTVDPQPPAYYLILKAVQGFLPSSEAGLRSFSALCSIMSLILILIFVKRWWNSRAAFYAGLWITLSTFDLYYAQETRNYTLLGLLWLLGYILMIEAMRGRPRLLVVWGVVNVLIS